MFVWNGFCKPMVDYIDEKLSPPVWMQKPPLLVMQHQVKPTPEGPNEAALREHVEQEEERRKLDAEISRANECAERLRSVRDKQLASATAAFNASKSTKSAQEKKTLGMRAAQYYRLYKETCAELSVAEGNMMNFDLVKSKMDAMYTAKATNNAMRSATSSMRRQLGTISESEVRKTHEESQNVLEEFGEITHRMAQPLKANSELDTLTDDMLLDEFESMMNGEHEPSIELESPAAAATTVQRVVPLASAVEKVNKTAMLAG